MDTDEPAAAPVLPIYQQLLEEVDAATRETVIAQIGTQQDSHRPDQKQATDHTDAEGQLTTHR